MSPMGDLDPTAEMRGATVPSPTFTRRASPVPPAPDNF